MKTKIFFFFFFETYAYNWQLWLRGAAVRCRENQLASMLVIYCWCWCIVSISILWSSIFAHLPILIFDLGFQPLTIIYQNIPLKYCFVYKAQFHISMLELIFYVEYSEFQDVVI